LTIEEDLLLDNRIDRLICFLASGLDRQDPGLEGIQTIERPALHRILNPLHCNNKDI